MSGLEVIGVLGSIFQLADAGFKLTSTITEIYERFKYTPKLLRYHIVHIEQLVQTSCRIKSTPELQNPTVHHHLKATLFEAERLQRILDRIIQDPANNSSKKRLWKAVTGGEERKLAASFARLEKEKNSLILCINVTHTETLFAHTKTLSFIRSGIDEIAGLLHTTEIDQRKTIMSATMSRELTTQQYDIVNKVMNTVNEKKEMVLYDNDIKLKPRTTENVASTNPAPTHEEVRGISDHVFSNNESKDDGVAVFGNLMMDVPADHVFDGNKALDTSLMIIGNIESYGAHKFSGNVAINEATIVGGNFGKGVSGADVEQRFKRASK